MISRYYLLCLFLTLFLFTNAQIKLLPDSVKATTDTASLFHIKPRKFASAAFVFGTNMGVWAFDRLVLDADFSRINIKTISNNVKTGFVWDEDMFTTNLFAHPYHGGLYFNSARSNGLSFWGSAPYVAGGSLMWEYCMENESPSINDFFATSVGGLCLGEITYRISDLLIDERTVGFERFCREFLSTVISPINGFNRLFSGRMKKTAVSRNNSIIRPVTLFYATIGHRIMADNLKKKQDVVNTVSYDLGLYYGNSFDNDNDHPYDAFTLKMSGNFFNNQPIIHRFSALGQLYSRNISKKESKNHFVWGVFQHFNFYQSNAEIDHQMIYPYKISEAAAVGPGLMFRHDFSSKIRLYNTNFVSLILLGGSQTDHYSTEKRDYNMGSGFSTKTNWDLEFGNKGRLFLAVEDYRIYSWIGSKIPNSSAFVPNSQGDIGNANLMVSRVGFQVKVKKHFLISNEMSYIYRKSYYKYYEQKTVKHIVQENKISIGYVF